MIVLLFALILIDLFDSLHVVRGKYNDLQSMIDSLNEKVWIVVRFLL